MPSRRSRARVRRTRTAVRRYGRRTAPGTRRRTRYRARPRRSLGNLGRKWTNPLPQTVCLKLRFIDHGYDLSTAAVTGYRRTYVFRGNSIFDPDLTGVGVQPYGFDEWDSLMGSGGQYKVYASAITINFSLSGSTATNVRFMLVPSRQTTLSYSDISDIRNTRYSKQSITSAATGIGRGMWIKNYMSTSKMFPGVGKGEWDLFSAMNSNPSVQWYWHVFVDTSIVGQDVGVAADVKITYYVRLLREGNANES